jgi:hypothetical protein
VTINAKIGGSKWMMMILAMTAMMMQTAISNHRKFA